MTEDQIKAIAEEYIHWVSKNPKDWPYLRKVSDVEVVLKFLNERFCIVEREKVIDEYKETCDEIAFETEIKSVLHLNVALGRKSLLEDLFGASMFNQNGE